MITVCIPFYSGLDYLKAAIASVQSQTYQHWRLILVDDHGPEGDLTEFCARYNDPRITYIRNPVNIGLAGNWNRCLDMAEGGLVTLLHADDELDPEYLEKMVQADKAYPNATAFFCQALVIGKNGQRTFSFPDFVKLFIMPSRKEHLLLQGDTALAQLLKGNFIFCPTLCYRIEALKGRRFDKSWKMVLDLAFFAEILFEGGLIVGLPERLYRYRRHENNQTVKLGQTFERFYEEISIYNQLSLKARERNWPMTCQVGHKKLIIRLHLVYQIAQSLLKRDWTMLKRSVSCLHSLGWITAPEGGGQ